MYYKLLSIDVAYEQQIAYFGKMNYIKVLS